MHEITVTGIGFTGNKIAELSVDKDFNTIAINSTKIDTEILEKTQNIIHIGEDGCGKSRAKAKKLVKANPSRLIEEINSFCGTSDIVVITGSSAGGVKSAHLL